MEIRVYNILFNEVNSEIFNAYHVKGLFSLPEHENCYNGMVNDDCIFEYEEDLTLYASMGRDFCHPKRMEIREIIKEAVKKERLYTLFDIKNDA